jgi:hypothetical protein
MIPDNTTTSAPVKDAVPLTAAQRRRDNTTAERKRRARERKRDGLVPVGILEVRAGEIDILVATKLLAEKERDDKHAIVAALYRVLDVALPAIENGALQPL